MQINYVFKHILSFITVTYSRSCWLGCFVDPSFIKMNEPPKQQNKQKPPAKAWNTQDSKALLSQVSKDKTLEDCMFHFTSQNIFYSICLVKL